MNKRNDLIEPNWAPYMRRALVLASLGEGMTSPNPLVGAVVLDRNNQIVGDGFHSRAGKPHAEVVALKNAGSKAKDGTLIVTLEPCCHFGRTPPCTEAIIKSGLKKVVVSLEDPDPRVSGAGISRLKDAGIEVQTGILKDQAEYQNRAFIHRIKTGRPWGVLKWAMSLDGRIALPNGKSQWISGRESRENVYKLRSTSDAVIIGGGTLRADDPLLTSRGLCDPEPLRVVMTRSCDMPTHAKLWDSDIAKTIVAFSNEFEKDKLNQLPKQVERLKIPVSEPLELLNALAAKGCNSVLWESGPFLSTQAIKQKCVQELLVVVSPKLLGGINAMAPLGDFGFENMGEIIEMKRFFVERVGEDMALKMVIDST